MTTDDLRAQYKPQADRQVKVRLGLEKIAQLEGIKPTEEECEEELKRLSEAYGMPLENVKGLVNMDMVSADLANQKAVEFVRANAIIKEPEAGEGE